MAVSTLAVCLGAVVSVAAAQPAITSDGTLGTAVSRAGRAYTVQGGTRSGANLFHSFERFDVPARGSVTFTGPGATANVISRVTGGAGSTIAGPISTRGSMPNANFFLINPHGVVFAEGATLDVGASFHAATSESLVHADGAIFSATPRPGEVPALSAAAPAAFGFLGRSPAAIVVDRAQLSLWPPSPGAPGHTLSLVGGGVEVRNLAILSAPGGRIQIGSVASPGTAELRPLDLGLASFQALGDVTIHQAFVQASGGPTWPSGSVSVQSGRLVVDNAAISVETFGVAGPPRGIDLRATVSIAIRNSAIVKTETFFGVAAGSGISIDTPALTVENATVTGRARAGAASGGIDIEASRVEIVNGIIRTSSENGGAGDIAIAVAETIRVAGPAGEISTGTEFGALAGDIGIAAGSVMLEDRAIVRSGGLGERGGRVTLTGRDSVHISGLAGVASLAFQGDAGDVVISTPRLSLDNGFVNTSTIAAGNAGSVAVDVGTLTMTNGAQIASASRESGFGSAGRISIAAAESISMSGTGDVGEATFTGDARAGLFSTTDTSGAAGEIRVTTSRLTIADQATISVETSGTATARGGRVVLDTRDIALSGGGTINSGTTGAAPGGAIEVHADRLSLVGAGTGVFSNAGGAGAGGRIGITAAEASILDGARLSATSAGDGHAGDIGVTVGSLRMSGGLITTAAEHADGGNISIGTTGSLLHLTDSGITTSVGQGAGAGGNITIGSTTHPFDAVVLNGSEVRADAHGGPGGNVDLTADIFLTSNSILSASSALGVPGTIDVQAAITDVSGSIVQLPESVLQAASLLRASCAARLAGGKTSSLVVGGRDGVPLEPPGLLSSPLATIAATQPADRTGPAMPALEEFRPASRTWLARDCAR
jgi:filamentous hemagglutinin family protein